jgi:hypothetical protein
MERRPDAVWSKLLSLEKLFDRWWLDGNGVYHPSPSRREKDNIGMRRGGKSEKRNKVEE